MHRPVPELLGVRFDELPVKSELQHEVGLALEPPQVGTDIRGVSTVVIDDMVVTKLMANSDRWSADEVLSSDLVELAMLLPEGTVPEAARRRVLRAYAKSVKRDLTKAIEDLLARESGWSAAGAR